MMSLLKEFCVLETDFIHNDTNPTSGAKKKPVTLELLALYGLNHANR